ncbi:MAG TPA: prolipoprotein diacylglyceryl transferase [Chryseolinea sp.]|nr:prolipoprotein diacylglyceryl transferase [Chryseolinea sp.]
MAILSYIIWNGNPEIFSIGPISLRWYGLFFAVSFLIGQQIFYYIYKKEGKSEKDVDTLTIVMVLATLLGARLGHVIFYDPQMFLDDPIGILIPIKFSPFRLIGYQGLASHGAAFGILFAIWLYSKYTFGYSKNTIESSGKKGASESSKKNSKGSFFTPTKRSGQSFLQVVDRIVIIVALAGAMIRLGNYFNSEIIGKPTDKPWGVVFVGNLSEEIKDKRVDRENIIESVEYIKNDSLPAKSDGRKPISIYIFFKQGTSEQQVYSFMDDQVKNILYTKNNDFIDIPQNLHLDYQTVQQENGATVARIKTYGIALHPSQLYESISCVFLFALLFFIWAYYKENLPEGRLLGIFLIVCFGLRFFYEFLKKNQVSFEETLPINMGQILSIPLFLAGVIILLLSFRKKGQPNS